MLMFYSIFFLIIALVLLIIWVTKRSSDLLLISFIFFLVVMLGFIYTFFTQGMWCNSVSILRLGRRGGVQIAHPLHNRFYSSSGQSFPLIIGRFQVQVLMEPQTLFRNSVGLEYSSDTRKVVSSSLTGTTKILIR